MTPDPSTEALLATVLEAFRRGTRPHEGWEDFSAANNAARALAARLSQAEEREAAAREFIAYTKDYYGHLLHGEWHAHARAALAASSAGETPE